MQELPKLMAMGDAMKYLKVSRQYIDLLVETGKLRCQKISTGKIFLESDILVFNTSAKRRHHRNPREAQKVVKFT